MKADRSAKVLRQPSSQALSKDMLGLELGVNVTLIDMDIYHIICQPNSAHDHIFQENFIQALLARKIPCHLRLMHLCLVLPLVYKAT